MLKASWITKNSKPLSKSATIPPQSSNPLKCTASSLERKTFFLHTLSSIKKLHPLAVRIWGKNQAKLYFLCYLALSMSNAGSGVNTLIWGCQ